MGIGIHTGNALRGYVIGRLARERGAFVVFGGIHATLYPEEAFERGGADCVVRGDGDLAWGQVLRHRQSRAARRVYEGGRVDGADFKSARWDLLNDKDYMWASVQTVRGCSKHCSFCSVWRTDGQRPRQSLAGKILEEIVELRRRGFRFIALADDNFYPVSFADIANAERQNNLPLLARLKAMREERFDLMERLSALPDDMVFFTQITMESAEDPQFLKAMRKAHIRGALVGVESVTDEGLKTVFKDFNLSGENLVERLRKFQEHDIHVLGSFIFGLPTDREDTFRATEELARRSGLTFAQFVMLTPFCGTVDFERWERSMKENPPVVEGLPITRYWLIPLDKRPKMFISHPVMSAEEIQTRTQAVWDSFYSLGSIWRRSGCVVSLRARLAFLFVSKLYRQMYAGTGIVTDSARRQRATAWARRIAPLTLRLFRTKPMPELQMPAPALEPETRAALRILT